MGTWLATTPLGSAFKVFCGALVAAVLLTWTQEGQISFDTTRLGSSAPWALPPR